MKIAKLSLHEINQVTGGDICFDHYNRYFSDCLKSCTNTLELCEKLCTDYASNLVEKCLRNIIIYWGVVAGLAITTVTICIPVGVLYYFYKRFKAQHKITPFLSKS